MNSIVPEMSQKTSLQVQYTFLVPFFAAILHDYNVKLWETS